jgi:hypothetical protein
MKEAVEFDGSKQSDLSILNKVGFKYETSGDVRNSPIETE